MRLTQPLAILLALHLAGCDAFDGDAVAAGQHCRIAQAPRTLAQEISESSGAAVSRQHTGIVWTHNDSGGDADLFAVDASGLLLGVVTLTNARNIDWEDMALAECDSGHCLYVADTGDNNAERSSLEIYRLAEPEPAGTRSVVAETFGIRFPDGPRDAESLFVIPPERVFIITRGRAEPIAIYAYPGPLRSNEVVELQRVRTLSNGAVPIEDQITAADATLDGRWVVMRTRTSILIYAAAELLTGDAAARPIRVDVSTLGEFQGEAVAVGENGAVVLTSEGVREGLPGTVSILWCSILDSPGNG